MFLSKHFQYLKPQSKQQDSELSFRDLSRLVALSCWSLEFTLVNTGKHIHFGKLNFANEKVKFFGLFLDFDLW